MLRQRKFRLLFFAQSASYLGDAVFMIALSFAVLEVTGSTAALGTVLATGGAVLVLTLSVSGVWADRLPRIRIMVCADAARLVTQGVLAALLLTEQTKMWHLLVLVAIHQAATAFFQPARTGALPQLLEGRRLVAANGLLGTAENLVWTVGWAIGGLLVAAIGVGWSVALDATTFLVSIGLLLAIGRLPAAQSEEQTASFRRELGEGWREVRSRRWIWFTLVGATSFLLLYEGPLDVVGPAIAADDYSGASSWGFILAGAGAGATIGAIIATTGRLRRPLRTSLWMFLACAVMPVLLLIGAPVWALVVCNVVVGISFGLFDPLWNSALQRGVPKDRISRVSAWDWMGSLAGMPVGMALAGWLSEGIGEQIVLTGMAIGTLLVCIAFLREPAVRVIEELGRDRESPAIDDGGGA